MKNRTVLALPFLALGTFCPAAVPQAVTEYGLGAGNAATAATPARNLAKGIGGVFDSLNKAVDRNAEATATEPPTATDPAPHGLSRRAASRSRQSRRRVNTTEAVASVTPPAPAQPAVSLPPAPTHEDPRQIQAGIAYDEMLRRFGPPSMSITSESGRRTLWYSNGDHNYQVEVENGKVIAPVPTAP